MKKMIPVTLLGVAALAYGFAGGPRPEAASETTTETIAAPAPASYAVYLNGGLAPDREFALQRARLHARDDRTDRAGDLVAYRTGSPEAGATPH